MSGIFYNPNIVPLGGTGDSTLDAHGVLLGEGTSPVATVSGSSTGQVLTWVSTSADPTFQTPSVGGLVLLTSGTIAAPTATLDIVLTSYIAYRGLKFVLYGFIPSTNAVELYVRFSTDGGVSYIASGYNYALWSVLDSAASGANASGSDSKIIVGVSVGNGTTQGISTEMELFNPTNTALWSRVFFQSYLISSLAQGRIDIGGGAQESAQDTDAIRFLFSAGNIASGGYAVYGYA